MEPEILSRRDGQGSPDERLERLVEWLRRQMPEVQMIYRFGSSVVGEEHAGSDLDLAFLAREPLDSVRRWELQEDLAIKLRQKVDLVDLLSASTVLRMQVVSTGELLWSRDENERAWFEMYVYSSYARLQEERKEIVEQVLEEGKVLGD